MAAFVASLLLGNIIGASKPSYIPMPDGSQWAYGAGVLFFPISYINGEVLTEVNGYARARRVIWTGFAELAFMAFMEEVVVEVAPLRGWQGYGRKRAVVGQGWAVMEEIGGRQTNTTKKK